VPPHLRQHCPVPVVLQPIIRGNEVLHAPRRSLQKCRGHPKRLTSCLFSNFCAILFWLSLIHVLYTVCLLLICEIVKRPLEGL
jgi:hypothetical protein